MASQSLLNVSHQASSHSPRTSPTLSDQEMVNLADFHGVTLFFIDNPSPVYQRQTILDNIRKGVVHVDPEEMLSPLYKGDLSCLPSTYPKCLTSTRSACLKAVLQNPSRAHPFLLTPPLQSPFDNGDREGLVLIFQGMEIPATLTRL